MEKSANSTRPKSSEFGRITSALYSFFASRSKGHRKVYQMIVDDIARLNPRSILDIGCGPGIAISLLAERLPQASLYCIDPSPYMLENARKRFNKLGLGKRISLEVGSSSQLGFDRKFDVIYTSLSFHHWDTPVEDLKQILQRLEEGGTLIIYENLVAASSLEGKKHGGHGISKEFAEHLDIEDVGKSFETIDGYIVLRLSRLKQ